MFFFPLTNLKRVLACFILLVLAGCNTTVKSANTLATSTSRNCPDKPAGSLNGDRVKSIDLDSQTVKASAIVSPGKDQGYAFTAKAGQLINYRTAQNICTWIFTPNNEVINSTNLPVDGRYTMQVATLTGSTTFELEMSLENPDTGCSEKPTNPLTQPEKVELGSQSLIKSGQASAVKSVGYTFAAQAGQKLSYRTQDDICIWVYTPDNQLLSSGEIPQSGTYALQVSAPRGSTTFNLEMSLGTLETSQTSTFPSTTNDSSSRVQPERPAADEFVKNYYSNIKNHQYSDAWSKLTPNFQNKSSSYSEYTQWWDSVKEIQTGDIQLINQSSDLAVVSVELSYVMSNGQIFEDFKKHVYLVWSDESNSWLFDRKSAS